MLRLIAAALALSISIIACAEEPPVAASRPVLLIGNKGEDTVSSSTSPAARLGRSPTGRMPHEIAISPDGAQAAVVAYGGKSIDLFDVATRARLKTIDLTPNEGPRHCLAEGWADHRHHRAQPVDRRGRYRGRDGDSEHQNRSAGDAYGGGDGRRDDGLRPISRPGRSR